MNIENSFTQAVQEVIRERQGDGKDKLHKARWSFIESCAYPISVYINDKNMLSDWPVEDLSFELVDFLENMAYSGKIVNDLFLVNVDFVKEYEEPDFPIVLMGLYNMFVNTVKSF